MKQTFSPIITTFAFVTLCASAPAVEKTDLFEAGKNGYVLYRIPGVVVTKIRESS